MDQRVQRPAAVRRFKVGEWLARPQVRQLIGPSGEVTVEARSMDVLVALALVGRVPIEAYKQQKVAGYR